MRDIFMFIIACLISVFLALISRYLEKRNDDKREQEIKEWLEKDFEEKDKWELKWQQKLFDHTVGQDRKEELEI